MLWSWTHLIFGIILLIAIIGGLMASQAHAKIWVTIARICYIVLLASGLFMLGYAWHEHPLLTVVKVALAVGLIGLVESAFAKKLKSQFFQTMFFSAIILTVIVVAVGFILTGGFPLF